MRRLRNMVRYAFIIILNVFIMLVFHSYVNLILLVGLILFPFYSIYGIHKVKESLTLWIVAPDENMERGSRFYLRFFVKNPTWFPVVNATLKLKVGNQFYQEEGIHYLNLPIRAKKETEVVYPVVMDYSGCFQISSESICLVDLLGIYEVTIPINAETECLVFPGGKERNQEAGRIYMQGVAEAMESREKGYDFSEISGIREYIPGDKLQNIHWKLSVKKDELMVKERVSVSAMQLNVLVELANDKDMCLESVLELTDSITKAFVMQNLPFTIYYYSTNMGELKGCYIGNEIERIQWMEMLLYDRCYEGAGLAEEMFFKQNLAARSYLYIGHALEDAAEGNIISGEKRAAAVLRG